MLSAARTARQLLHSFLSIPKMGDHGSKIVSPQEALPGREEPIRVAGKNGVRRGARASAQRMRTSDRRRLGTAGAAGAESRGPPLAGGVGSAQAQASASCSRRWLCFHNAGRRKN